MAEVAGRAVQPDPFQRNQDRQLPALGFRHAGGQVVVLLARARAAHGDYRGLQEPVAALQFDPGDVAGADRFEIGFADRDLDEALLAVGHLQHDPPAGCGTDARRLY